MRRKVISLAFLFSFTVLFPQVSRLKESQLTSLPDWYYRKIRLEEFSANDWQKNLNIQKSLRDGSSSIFPVHSGVSPDENENGSLLVRVAFSSGKLDFNFIQPIEIKDFISSFSLLVYSTDLPGKLQLLVEDTRGSLHLLDFSSLHFTGWQEITIDVPPHVIQDDFSPGSVRLVLVKKIIYTPGPAYRKRLNQTFILDALTAKVRDKYLLREIP